MKYSLRSLMIVAGLCYLGGAALMIAGQLAISGWPVPGLSTVVCGLLMFGTGAGIGLIQIGRMENARRGWGQKTPNSSAPPRIPPSHDP
jgi:hypothetical protein